MTQHTPGPWSMMWSLENAKTKVGRWLLSDANQMPVLPRCGRDDARCEANAKLMSAAPELLQAVRDLLGEVAYLEGQGEVTARHAYKDGARAAIMKATGEGADHGQTSTIPIPHYLYKSTGLWWIRKGDDNPTLEGPFMDAADAIEQTDEPGRVLINHGPK